MGTGSAFADELSPQVMVRVRQPGDIGVIEISEILFTTKKGQLAVAHGVECSQILSRFGSHVGWLFQSWRWWKDRSAPGRLPYA